jgi:hypothetical protein
MSTMVQNLSYALDIENYPLVRDCNHGMGGANATFLVFLRWKGID